MRDRNAVQPIRHRILTLRARHNDLTYTRVGYAVGRPVGGAVIRNRIKRQLRALVRELPLAPGYDIVITPRPFARNASFQEIKSVLISSCNKSDLIDQESL
jgi:ribonuclease P protein component